MSSAPIVALWVCWAAPAAAQGVAARPSPALQELRRIAAEDPAGLPTMEDAKAGGGEGFTGESAPVANVSVLSPVEIIDAPRPRQVQPPSQTEGADEGTPSYHFRGVTPLDGLTIYTAEKDAPGQDNRTKEPAKPMGILDYAKWGAIGLGAAGLIAGAIIASPVLLVIGALLLGVGLGLMLSKLFGK